MKKIIAGIVICLFLAPVCFAGSVTCRTSGLSNESHSVTIGRGALTGAMVVTDGTNTGTLTVYDGYPGGNIVFGPFAITGSQSMGGMTWEIPVRYEAGLYMSITGTGAKAEVWYTNDL